MEGSRAVVNMNSRKLWNSESLYAGFLGLYTVLLLVSAGRFTVDLSGGSEIYALFFLLPLPLIFGVTLRLMLCRLLEPARYLLAGFAIWLPAALSATYIRLFPMDDVSSMLLLLIHSASIGVSSGILYAFFFRLSPGHVWKTPYFLGLSLGTIGCFFPVVKIPFLPILLTAGGIPLYLLLFCMRGFNGWKKYPAEILLALLYLVLLPTTLLTPTDVPVRHMHNTLYGTYRETPAAQILKRYPYERLRSAWMTLQTDANPVDVLLYAPRGFRTIPAFVYLPTVGNVDVFFPDTASMESAFRQIPEIVLRRNSLSFYSGNPRSLLSGEKQYDLILIAPVQPFSIADAFLLSEDSVRKIKRRLKKNGVLALELPSPEMLAPVGLRYFSGNVEAALDLNFRSVLHAPDSYRLLLASDGPMLTPIPRELDLRVEKRFGRTIFPSGVMEVLAPFFSRQSFSLPSMKGIPAGDTDLRPILNTCRYASFFENPYGRFFQRTVDFLAPFSGWLLSGALLAYLVSRYFLSARMDRKMLYTSFENGVYAFGTSVLLCYLLQLQNGTLAVSYSVVLFPILFLGICSAFMMDFTSKQKKIISFFAILLPPASAALLLLSRESAMVLCFLFLLLTVFYAAVAQRAFCEKSGLSSPASGTLLTAFFCGGSLGILFAVLTLMPFSHLIAGALFLGATRIGRLRDA